MNIQERRNREGKITSYRIRVYDHRDALTGKQYFRTVSVKYVAGKSEAWNRRNAEKEAVLFEKNTEGLSKSASRKSFADYCSYAIAAKELSGIASSTVHIYRTSLKRISPYLGHIRMDRLTPPVINEAYRRMEKDGISLSSIYQFHLFIHSVLSMAVKENIISRNHADAALPPRQKSRAVRTLSESELISFFSLLYSDRSCYFYQVLFTLLVISGCRIGELCALDWKDISFSENQIRFRRHFMTDERGLVIEEGGKTAASERELFLDTDTMSMLEGFRTYGMKERARRGSPWDGLDGAVFFSSRKGFECINPASVRNWLKSFCRKNGLPDIHPHMFRHTSISLQLSAGISLADAARRAGHSRPDVTLRIYSHSIRNNDILCCSAVTSVLPPFPGLTKT